MCLSSLVHSGFTPLQILTNNFSWSWLQLIKPGASEQQVYWHLYSFSFSGACRREAEPMSKAHIHCAGVIETLSLQWPLRQPRNSTSLLLGVHLPLAFSLHNPSVSPVICFLSSPFLFIVFPFVSSPSLSPSFLLSLLYSVPSSFLFYLSPPSFLFSPLSSQAPCSLPNKNYGILVADVDGTFQGVGRRGYSWARLGSLNLRQCNELYVSGPLGLSYFKSSKGK